MRILVISDSHGRVGEIEKAIEAQKDAKNVFFLGDCIRDVEDMPYIYPDRNFYCVCGNCDFGSLYKTEDTVILGGKKIFFTHGHSYSVKSGLSRLKAKAVAEGIDIVLYGHTHIANIEYDDGVYFVNPGSLCSSREGGTGYAVIDIEAGGIMPIIIRT